MKIAFDADGEIGFLRKHPIVFTQPNKIKKKLSTKSRLCEKNIN